jgi:ABC-2 type transport system ATP-binding protein
MPKEYQDRVLEMAEFMGLKKDLFKPLKTFSGGMKRKLEIIRGLMHNPKVLFLDEPSQGLDAVSRRDLWSYLQNVAKTKKTTIFLTTHYIEEAENADRVCIINHGQIVFLGTPY